MNCIRFTITCCIICVLAFCSTASAAGGQLGFGYGKELRGNTDISQIGIFYRMPLSYSKKLGDVWQLNTDLEFSAAVLDDNNSETSSSGLLSLMPQMTISPNEYVHFLFGVGVGGILGETEFDDHNLGGPFFISSKIGVQLLLGKHFGLEYNFYHQSNAGIYEFNASLNMHLVALSYRF